VPRCNLISLPKQGEMNKNNKTVALLVSGLAPFRMKLCK
jgi:hypothetical protein